MMFFVKVVLIATLYGAWLFAEDGNTLTAIVIAFWAGRFYAHVWTQQTA